MRIPISGHSRPSRFFISSSSTSWAQSLILVGLGGYDARLVVGSAWVGAWRGHGYVVRERGSPVDALGSLGPLCCRGHVDLLRSRGCAASLSCVVALACKRPTRLRCRQRGSFLFLCLLDRFAVRETRNELEEQGAALVEIGKRVGVSPVRSRQEMLLTATPRVRC